MNIIGYVICLNNSEYSASLETLKIYPVIEPYINDPAKGYVRIIDESGEDYLYSDERFANISLSPQVEKQVKKSLALA